MKRSDFAKTISVSILVLLLILGGCAKNETAVIKKFSSIIRAKESVENLDKAARFIEENADEVSMQGMSTMILAYLDKVEKFVAENEDEAKACAGDERTSFGEFLLLLDSNGERISGDSDREEARVLPDYKKIVEKYKSSLHEDLILFLELKAESEKFLYTSSGTVADYMGYLVHTYKTEQLIKTHTGKDVLRQDAIEMFLENINEILTGSEALPVFDELTGEFSEEARIAYEDFAVKNPDSVLSDIFSEYFDYLNSIDWIIDKSDPVAIETFADTVIYFQEKAMKAIAK